MNRTVLASLACVLVLVGCSAPTSPTPLSAIMPTLLNTNVAISSVSLTRAPLRIEFYGNFPWRDAEGNLKTISDPHVLTRADLGGIPTNDGGTALENYLNQTWFPSQFRDADGALTGWAWIDILSFSPTDVNWRLCISIYPITSCTP